MDIVVGERKGVFGFRIDGLCGLAQLGGGDAELRCAQLRAGEFFDKIEHRFVTVRTDSSDYFRDALPHFRRGLRSALELFQRGGKIRIGMLEDVHG